MIIQSFLVVIFSLLSLRTLCQTQTLYSYQLGAFGIDTSLFVTIQKGAHGISFIFPVQKGMAIYTIKNDTIVESGRIPDNQSIYGPYKFKKKKNKIVFQDKNISNKLRALYELIDSVHLCPYLFSTSTDSYIIKNKLVDKNATLNIGETKLDCFKFFQVYSGHNPIRDIYYRVLYLDKASLIPLRIENYDDKECKYLNSVVFAKEYVKL